MAARPSPLAVRLAKEVAKLNGALETAQKKVVESERNAQAFAARLEQYQRDTNAARAADAEVATLRGHLLSNEAEVKRLRSILANIVSGGVHLPAPVRV